ncbi:helix-turn-helix domain-containing protein [Streptomyces sp. NBC_00996]|uniref:helix-turn-helix domain-containing protein n=1 Tax=Streptomyces sp. NBC_00996 TaxID=2903710 RepID=UPI00386557C5
MTEQQPSAPPRARSGHSGAGVDHVTERHNERFTVVGNHLAQHPDLSLTAIGLATHIQSLPKGARVGIKALAARFPEGELRIAAALRELETHGYLARIKERLPSGRIVTRTVSYNKPQTTQPSPAAPPPAPHREPTPTLESAAEPETTDLRSRRTAVDLLVGLRAYDARLLLTEQDVRRLAPAVSAWPRPSPPGPGRLRLAPAVSAWPRPSPPGPGRLRLAGAGRASRCRTTHPDS